MRAPKKDREEKREEKDESKMPSQSDRGSGPYDYEGKQSYRDSGDSYED